jgi:hypothetical protein
MLMDHVSERTVAIAGESLSVTCSAGDPSIARGDG